MSVMTPSSISIEWCSRMRRRASMVRTTSGLRSSSMAFAVEDLIRDRLGNTVRAVGREDIHRARGEDDDGVNLGREDDIVARLHGWRDDHEGPGLSHRAVLEHVEGARRVWRLEPERRERGGEILRAARVLLEAEHAVAHRITGRPQRIVHAGRGVLRHPEE